MLPITLDLARVRVILVGEGEAAHRRLALLDEAGAGALEVYAPSPDPALAAKAGARLRRRLPVPAEIAQAQLVFLARVPEPIAVRIGQVARAAGVLVNVEDDRGRSDFHSSAVLRRGDLVVAVSTEGKSPGLAALVRRDLEHRLGPEWAARLDEVSRLRALWRGAGADAATVRRRTAEWAAARGWIAASPQPPAPPRADIFKISKIAPPVLPVGRGRGSL